MCDLFVPYLLCSNKLYYHYKDIYIYIYIRFFSECLWQKFLAIEPGPNRPVCLFLRALTVRVIILKQTFPKGIFPRGVIFRRVFFLEGNFPRCGIFYRGEFSTRGNFPRSDVCTDRNGLVNLVEIKEIRIAIIALLGYSWVTICRHPPPLWKVARLGFWAKKMRNAVKPMNFFFCDFCDF